MKPNINYNPDILACLANLSNDEVFTPPKIANQILDLLPAEIWKDKNTKFLDPMTKSGVFLREITKRLINGLENEMPDLQERINHILHNQVYGIAITELTALLSRRSIYCAKEANGRYSIADKFENESGNVRYQETQHQLHKGKCKFCGANEKKYVRDKSLETHAYEFIHTENPGEIFDMKFDVIIGNPPYQMDDGGHGMSAKPIYHHFVEQAKKLNPRFLSMIIPARWYAGGKGLDSFRAEMLNDRQISHLVDYQNSADIFSGVDIAGGICYFLWQKDYSGDCEVTNIDKNSSIKSHRKLNEFNIFIRNDRAIPIIKKILSKNENDGKQLSAVVSSRKPFNLATKYLPKKEGIPCWYKQSIGLEFAHKSDITDNNNYLNKWKLLIPPAPISGQSDFSKPVRFYYYGNTRIAKPDECCTESWLVAGAFDTKEEVISFRSYLFTKTVRFLLLQRVISQHATREHFTFIPDLGRYSGNYTDEALIKRWNITKEEWQFINSKISAIPSRTLEENTK